MYLHEYIHTYQYPPRAHSSRCDSSTTNGPSPTPSGLFTRTHLTDTPGSVQPTHYMSSVQHTATHRNTLQHTATHCNTPQYIYTCLHTTCRQCNTLKHKRATYYNTLHHPASHCITLHHTSLILLGMCGLHTTCR